MFFKTYKISALIFIFFHIIHYTYCFNFFKKYTIASTFISNKSIKHKNSNCDIVILKFNNSLNKICIEEYDFELRSVINHLTPMFIYGKNKTTLSSLNDYKLKFVKGFYIGRELNSAVEGVIEDNRFYGKLFDNGIVYYVERLEHFPNLLEKYDASNINNYAILYRYEDVYPQYQTFLFDSNFSSFLKLNDNYFNEFNARPKRKSLDRGNICPLLIVVDTSYYNLICNNNLRTAVIRVLTSIHEANSIFRTTDFNNDGIPDNIGFSIKYLVITTSPDNELNVLPFSPSAPLAGKNYIFALSRFQLLSQVCLGVAFTAQQFTENTLGLSYLALSKADLKLLDLAKPGGICSRPSSSGFNFNALAVSALVGNDNATYRVPQVMFDLALAHELGHGFGTDHDDGVKCKSMLMAASGHKGNARSNYLFSECSKAQIYDVIEAKGDCLITDNSPFCGNGLVEDREECDCGLTIDCITRDPCCRSESSGNVDCKVNKASGYQCHPSQGLCCLENCTYRNINHLGLDCSKIFETCPCKNGTSYCSCGLLGECVGSECHSRECTRIGLIECACTHNANNYCEICCENPETHECTLAKNLTQSILLKNDMLFSSLLDSKSDYELKFNGSEFITYATFYNKNNLSVSLPFSRNQENEFCVTRGILGICNNSGICDLQIGKVARYPVIEATNNSNILARMGNVTNNSFRFISSNSVFLLYLFINATIKYYSKIVN